MSYTVELELKLYNAILGWRRAEIDDDVVMMLDTRQVGGTLMWEVDQRRWKWALDQACRALGMDSDNVSVDYIALPTSVPVAGVTPYVRRHRDHGTIREVRHEAIRSSSRIRVKVVVLDTLEHGNGDTRPPTQDELFDMFKLVGDNIGLSPYGSQLGYGRFSVTVIEKKK